MWRNAYTAASLLCAVSLAGLAQPQRHARRQAADVTSEHARDASRVDSETAVSTAAALRALRQLDMAALLGGPLFRPQLDACIASLQTRVSAKRQQCSPPGAAVFEHSVDLLQQSGTLGSAWLYTSNHKGLPTRHLWTSR